MILFYKRSQMLTIFRTGTFSFENTRVLSPLVNVLAIRKIEKIKEKRRKNNGKKSCVLRHVGCWNASDDLVFCIKQQRILMQIASWKDTKGVVCRCFWEDKCFFLAFYSLNHGILKGVFLTNNLYKYEDEVLISSLFFRVDIAHGFIKSSAWFHP